MLFKDLQKCTQGFFCSLGASDPNPVSESFGDQCRAGSFCPAGASGPTYCPIGMRLHQDVLRQFRIHSTMKEEREAKETKRQNYFFTYFPLLFDGDEFLHSLFRHLLGRGAAIP